MASAQYTAGTVPTLILSAPQVAAGGGPAGWFYLTNGTGGTIYTGGSAVTSSNGASVAASTTLTGFLFAGDAVYVCTAAGTSTVGVLQNGF